MMKRELDDDTDSHDKSKEKRKRLSSPSSRSLDALPSALRYEISYMHRDVVTHVAVARQTEFILSASRDGHVKFWRKMPDSIEFVKHFVAHLERLVSFEVSSDGQRLLTASTDATIKLFDISQFDMSGMIDLGFIPSYATWLSQMKIVVAASTQPVMRVYDVNDSTSESPCLVELKIHAHPVTCIAFNNPMKAMISVDSKGIIEYWDNGDNYDLLNSDKRKDSISFRLKSDTDLYELAKNKATAMSMSVSKAGNMFAVCASNRCVYLYKYSTGTIVCKLDESAAYYATTDESCRVPCLVEGFSMGSRMTQQVELELEQQSSKKDTSSNGSNGTIYGDRGVLFNAIFDETDQYLLYGSPLGIKIMNLHHTSSLVKAREPARVLCQLDDSERFLCLALYQGVSKVDKQYLLSKAKNNANNESSSSSIKYSGGGGGGGGAEGDGGTLMKPDPVLICSAFNKHRLYCVTRREPSSSSSSSSSSLRERDVLNEVPTEEELDKALASTSTTTTTTRKSLPTQATLHTSKGDILVKLFPQECPRTVENFISHATSGYYENTIFHRVIKHFMIQGGDPDGDGTGGESMWGGSFDDEIVPQLRHSLPFQLSMANSGPNTNGSQFFITTAPTPHLDDKHTLFGKVIKGFEVVTAIESVPTNSQDTPLAPVKVLSVSV